MFVNETEFAALVQERDQLRKRVTELLAANNREVERRRAAEAGGATVRFAAFGPSPERLVPEGHIPEILGRLTTEDEARAQSRAHLAQLIENAVARGPMSPAELWDQRVSWVYGQLPEGNTLTRKQVEDLVTEKYGPRPTEKMFPVTKDHNVTETGGVVGKYEDLPS